MPSQQHEYADLPALGESTLHLRREWVFLALSGMFLGSLAMLNILGVTRFLNVAFFIEGSEAWRYKVAIAVGVLPYPITFLCTDFISELYGRRRANQVVLMGFFLNLWVMAVLWIGGAWPGFEAGGAKTGVFFEVRRLAFGAVAASMIAYLAAQYIDVQIFHFWRRVTNGKHLWLRNNGSTLVSQLVDTISVILITHYYAHALPLDKSAPIALQLVAFIATGYVFKVVMALLDTIPFYVGTHRLARWLRLPPPTHPHRPVAAAAAEAGVG